MRTVEAVTAQAAIFSYADIVRFMRVSLLFLRRKKLIHPDSAKGATGDGDLKWENQKRPHSFSRLSWAAKAGHPVGDALVSTDS
ncbi:MAG TPA: hypothetical protein VGG10_22215 [Rhizomicrobium sp.]